MWSQASFNPKARNIIKHHLRSLCYSPTTWCFYQCIWKMPWLIIFLPITITSWKSFFIRTLYWCHLNLCSLVFPRRAVVTNILHVSQLSLTLIEVRAVWLATWSRNHRLQIALDLIKQMNLAMLRHTAKPTPAENIWTASHSDLNVP